MPMTPPARTYIYCPRREARIEVTVCTTKCRYRRKCKSLKQYRRDYGKREKRK